MDEKELDYPTEGGRGDVCRFRGAPRQRIEEMSTLLAEKRMKQLQQLLEENDEFDVAEFLSELPEHQMAMVFRMLSKEHGAEVFAELDTPEQEYIINSITDSEPAASSTSSTSTIRST
jgi:Mg/Co/Ni transporter MgtE